MRRSVLQRALYTALLVGTPLTLTSCIFGQSSCPDDGWEPPMARVVAVDVSLGDGGPLDEPECAQACAEFGAELVTCVRETAESVLCFKRPSPCEGRRPAGLREGVRSAHGSFECHLADAAWLEAASIDAFRLLRRELRAHGAPRRLLRAASRSARDERRHARATRALARRFGVEVAPVERDATAPRDLEAMALENAVEGCVRETWGALIALRQASQASEPAVRETMARVARDEVRHAELAWSVHAWLQPRLNRTQRARVLTARRAAFAELSRDIRSELPEVDRQRLGLPNARQALAMLSELERSLTGARA